MSGTKHGTFHRAASLISLPSVHLIQLYQVLDLLLCIKMCPRHISMSPQPRALLSLISLCQIVCSAAGRVQHLPANALTRACATILLCESEAIGCLVHSLPFSLRSGAPSVSQGRTRLRFRRSSYSANFKERRAQRTNGRKRTYTDKQRTCKGQGPSKSRELFLSVGPCPLKSVLVRFCPCKSVRPLGPLKNRTR